MTSRFAFCKKKQTTLFNGFITYQQAWENIEMIADAIDVVVALVENNQMSDETGKAATVDYLLKVYTDKRYLEYSLMIRRC
jgi:hypothetical protein